MRAKRDYVKRKAKVDRWLKENPERAREIARAAEARRRGRELAAGGGWTAAEFRKVVAGQKHRCWWCSAKFKPGKRQCHADHRIALALGGSNDISNIVASCPQCNYSKNAKTPWEFAGRLL